MKTGDGERIVVHVFMMMKYQKYINILLRWFSCIFFRFRDDWNTKEKNGPGGRGGGMLRTLSSPFIQFSTFHILKLLCIFSFIEFSKTMTTCMSIMNKSLYLFYIFPIYSVTTWNGMVNMEKSEDQDRKIVLEFCHLLEKSKQLFNGLRYVDIFYTAFTSNDDDNIMNLKSRFSQRFTSIWSSTVASIFRSHIRCIHKTLEISTTTSTCVGFKVWPKTMANRRNC